MKRCLVLAAVLWSSSAWGQTPEPSLADDAIKLPVIVAPIPPVPPPAPGAVPVLPAKVSYAIASNKPFFVLASPGQLVSVTYELGPITIKGHFIEAPEKYVSRKFTEKYIADVEAVGTGRVELVIVPSGVTKEADIIRRLVDCQVAPIPPPVPPVPPVPPGPTPAPIPGPGLHALFVYESSTLTSLPAAQLAALYSKVVRDYMRSKSIDFRFYDADVSMDGETQLWKDAMKLKRDSLPWVIISDGTKGLSGPMPADIDGTLKLLKTIGG